MAATVGVAANAYRVSNQLLHGHKRYGLGLVAFSQQVHQENIDFTY